MEGKSECIMECKPDVTSSKVCFMNFYKIELLSRTLKRTWIKTEKLSKIRRKIHSRASITGDAMLLAPSSCHRRSPAQVLK